MELMVCVAVLVCVGSKCRMVLKCCTCLEGLPPFSSSAVSRL